MTARPGWRPRPLSAAFAALASLLPALALADGAGTEEVENCPALEAGDEERRVEIARDSYLRGVVYYQQGDYEAAVSRFVATYCHSDRYPGYFYDIGQTFERLPDFEKAVAYFERYLREAEGIEAEEANWRKALTRVEVLKNMPARVTVATEPPGAQVTVRSASGVVARGESSSGEPLAVTRGTYTMQVELEGHEPEARVIEVGIAQPYSFFFKLEKRRGWLRVVARPRDARIFLERELVGIGRYDDQVPIGTYRVSAEVAGREPEQREVQVTEGRPVEVEIVLPEPVPTGRTELLVASSAGMSMIAGAAAIAVAGDPDSEVVGIAAATGLGLGVASSYLWIPRDYPRARGNFLIGTSAIGAANGLLTASLVCALSSASDCVRPESGAMVGGALAGLGFGALTASRFDLDAGDVALIHSGAVWGTVTGALFFSLFEGTTTDRRLRSAMPLAGLNLGVAAGVLIAPHVEMSRARTVLLDLGGLTGLAAGFMAASATEAVKEQRLHFTLVGMSAGLIAAVYLTKDMDEPAAVSLPAIAPEVGAVLDAAGRPTTVLGTRLAF